MQSEAAKQQQGLSAITDVTDSAVLELLDSHGWPTLIHGHTHRPATHHLPAGHAAERWVIRDWHGSSGGYLRLDADGLQAHALQGNSTATKALKRA
jgi:UDP-2,3-diacylglucosamine hydrolase